MKNKVLLIYAGEEARLPRLPTNLLVLAAYIREQGFEPFIFDTRVDIELPDLKDFLVVGISAMTVGIKYGIDVVKKIKEKHPNIKFIWGGPHVTFFPEQSLKSKYVDVVVMREGEEGLLEVLNAMRDNKPYEKIIDKEFMDLEKLPFPAYDLVDMDKYASINDGFNYESSRGCPSRCNFCYVHLFHKRRWRAKSVKKVLDEVERIIQEYKIKKLLFVEDNVFVNKKRAMNIAQGFIDRKFNIEWEAMARADYLAKYTEEEMKLLKQSGWWNAAIGGESGSEDLLKLIQKDITTKEIKQSVINCLKVGVQPQVSFIMGIPGERREDRIKTLDFYNELKGLAENPDDVEINAFFIYTPYPGTPLYEKAIELGYKAPQTLEEWADWKFSDINNVPWIDRKLRRELETISIIVRFWFYLDRIKHFSKEYQKQKLNIGVLGKILMKIGIPLLKASARLRWDYRFFYFPYEWDLFRWYRERSTEIN